MSIEDMHNTKYDELTLQNDCSSFSSSEESTDFFVSDNEKAPELISLAKKSECDYNITELSTAISDNRSPCSQNSSSIVPDRRRRSVSSPLVGAVDLKNKQVKGSRKEAIDIDGACKAAYARQQLSLREIEDNKTALETNNGNESGSTVRGRRRRNKAKAVEACHAAQVSSRCSFEYGEASQGKSWEMLWL